MKFTWFYWNLSDLAPVGWVGTGSRFEIWPVVFTGQAGMCLHHLPWGLISLLISSGKKLGDRPSGS